MASTMCTCAALRQASRYLTRLYDEALAPTGLGINQYSILARLREHGPMPLQDLARTLVTDRSTLGHLVRPLQARNFLSITTGTRDARRRLLSLTDEGEAVLARAKPLWRDAQRRFEGAFGAADAAGLRDTLARLIATPVAVTGTTAPARSNSEELSP